MPGCAGREDVMIESRRVQVVRTPHRLLPDASRVLARPQTAASREVFGLEHSKARPLLERLLAIPEDDVAILLGRVIARFSPRHRNLEQILEHHFQVAAADLPAHAPLSRSRRLLVGAYVSMEYAIEGAALLNPSIVEAPDQSGVPGGARRFVLSLRAVGEGHISSIEFRSGVIGRDGTISLDATSPYVRTGHRSSPLFSKAHVEALATELGADRDVCSRLLEGLPDRFQADELERAIMAIHGADGHRALVFETVKLLRLVTASNYEVVFQADTPLSERVLVPAGPRETQGMEDARFVRFVDDDGSVRYYATYTAFDGFSIIPQLIQTLDFTHFRISTLAGPYARNKGPAIFPRRIHGRYAMLSRHDNQNLHVTYSDDVRTWNETRLLLEPRRPWDVVRLGNCGSPIETEAGWLVLTHGVGPFRQYAIGAILLDLDDPATVIGELPEPLLEADESERDGYVPNVVYSCGSMIHGDHVILPYGFADHGTRVALVSLTELLAALRPPRRRR
jgi:predicted GH43/DUF377 family glycosyl hydrolase